MELNERLRELRKEQGETQKQVAAAIGIGAVSYTHLVAPIRVNLGRSSRMELALGPLPTMMSRA